MHQGKNPPTNAGFLIFACMRLVAKTISPDRHLTSAMARNNMFVLTGDLFIRPPEEEDSSVMRGNFREVCGFHSERSSSRSVACRVDTVTRGTGPLELTLPDLNDISFLCNTVRAFKGQEE